jgi:hypothetical protein
MDFLFALVRKHKCWSAIFPTLYQVALFLFIVTYASYVNEQTISLFSGITTMLLSHIF